MDVGSSVGVNVISGTVVGLAGETAVEVLAGNIVREGEAEEQAADKTDSMIIA